MSDQTPYSGYSDSPQWQNQPQGGYPPSGQPQSGGYPPQQPYVPAQYQQPVYQAPVYVAAPSEPGSGMAVASLVLGILGIVLFWVWFLGLPLSIIGTIMGALGRRSISRRGIATAGLVCSIIGLVGGLIIVLLAIIAIASYHPYYYP